MGSFGDLLYDLAEAGGRGLEKGMAAQRKEDEEASAFKRMMPLRLEQHRGEKGVEEEFTIRGEGRKAAAEMEERGRVHGLLAPILERAMPPTVTQEVMPGATPEVLRERPSVTKSTPFKVSPETSLPAYKEVFDLLGKQQGGDHAHQPYDDAYRRVLAQTGDRVKAEEAGRLAAGQAAGAKLAGTEAIGPTRQQRQSFMGQYEQALPTRRFIDARDAYARIESVGTQVSPAGDLALIFGFMKLQDPTSVVREGEFATAANAAGVPDRIRNMYNKVIQGTRLTPEQRTDFLDTSKRTFEGHLKTQEEFEETHRRLAGALGMSESDVPDVLGRYRPRPGGPVRPPVKYNSSGQRIR